MKTSTHDQVSFWRHVAGTLKEAKGLIDALDAARSAMAETAFAPVAQALRQRVADGSTLSRAIGEMGDVFDGRVVAAVRNAEQTGTLDEAADAVADALEAGNLDLLGGDLPAVPQGAADRDVQGYINELIRRAARSNASDIHVQPTEDGRGRTRLRIDGVLHRQEPPPAGKYHATIARLKAMAAMDVAERRLPQDGRMILEAEGQPIDLRLSVVPEFFGERLVARLLVRTQVGLGLGNLGLSDEQAAVVRKLCHSPNGIIIATGPTGCGKTTLLYSMLAEANQEGLAVFTIEDPVEYTFEGISQLPIRPGIGLTFARLARSVLRQDPDVIMVGELRDLEMMNVSAQIALTGHLLLTTLHANSAPGAIKRLIDCGLEPFLVNASMLGAVSLRLIRQLCPKCKQPASPAAHSIPPEAAEFLQAHKDAEFCRPVGCEECRGTGYRGRTAIYEILVMDERLREVVASSADLAAIRAAAIASGMETMLTDGLSKAARGETSIAEVLRVVPRE